MTAADDLEQEDVECLVNMRLGGMRPSSIAAMLGRPSAWVEARIAELDAATIAAAPAELQPVPAPPAEPVVRFVAMPPSGSMAAPAVRVVDLAPEPPAEPLITGQLRRFVGWFVRSGAWSVREIVELFDLSPAQADEVRAMRPGAAAT